MFVFDALRDRVNAPGLISKLRINEPVRVLRNVDYLVLESHRVNYGLFEPINNVSRVFNVFAQVYSRSITRYGFRSAVKSFKLTNDILRRPSFLFSIN